MASDELFPVVNDRGDVVGSATRTFCHNGSKTLHPVVHLHILNARGELFLQQRSMSKDIQPGKWDTGVGGHIDYGELPIEALHREAREELGVELFTPKLLQRYIFESEVEREMVYVFMTSYDGKITIDPIELSDGRFWSRSEIEQNIGEGLFTPNFESEYRRLGEDLFK